MIQKFKLIDNKKLNYNVYELVFEAENSFNFISGQFITFILDVGGRAYSILKTDGKKITLIIKKIELNEGGRGGSKYLCELNLGDTIRGVGPAGHFILRQNNNNKLFFGTGTGFVPLYNQIVFGLKNNINCKFKIIFGARTESDLFYISELKKLKEKYKNFDFEIYLSRENILGYKNGYITDFIKNNTKNNFTEVYICGTPTMIDDAKKILLDNGFNNKNIFTEKY